MGKHEFHPAAEIFPMMSEAELKKLAEDIREHGLREPIVTFEGKILDGRNRYKACELADVEPKTESFTGEDPVAYVISANVHRRHLSQSQRALIAAKLVDMRQGERTDLEPSANLRKVSTAEAAKRMSVGSRTVEDAKEILRVAPEKAAEIERGEKTVHQAKREVRREKAAQKPQHGEKRDTVKPDGVFDVIVVDPPWPMERTEREPRSSRASSDLPAMSIEDIKAQTLPMAEDCHVWLWTTHRFLSTAFEVLRAWDVKYVNTGVWHKPKGVRPDGLQEYNCEFVLYGRRGNPAFESSTDFPLCFEASEGEDGAKPDEFYEMVCQATNGRCLEMFSGREIEGFTGWTKEAPADNGAA